MYGLVGVVFSCCCDNQNGKNAHQNLIFDKKMRSL